MSLDSANGSEVRQKTRSWRRDSPSCIHATLNRRRLSPTSWSILQLCHEQKPRSIVSANDHFDRKQGQLYFAWLKIEDLQSFKGRRSGQRNISLTYRT